jgi:hypothetical protein
MRLCCCKYAVLRSIYSFTQRALKGCKMPNPNLPKAKVLNFISITVFNNEGKYCKYLKIQIEKRNLRKFVHSPDFPVTSLSLDYLEV